MESTPVHDMEHDTAFDSAPMPRLSAFARLLLVSFRLFRGAGMRASCDFALPCFVLQQVCRALLNFASLIALFNSGKLHVTSRWASGGCQHIGQTGKEDSEQNLPGRGRTRGRQGRNESSGSDEPSSHADYQSFTEHAHEDGAEAEWERYRSTCPLLSTVDVSTLVNHFLLLITKKGASDNDIITCG
jgi:hypothetical protein